MSEDILIELGEVSNSTKGCPGYAIEYFFLDEQPKSGLPPQCLTKEARIASSKCQVNRH